MKVVVLGAGVVGVTTAWWLTREGMSVTIIDRQPGPGLETSFANGGQISANHATPWAGPGTPWKALKWLGRIDAPLLFHLRMDRHLAGWLARFLANCTPARSRRNTERALRVALYSRRQMAAIRQETGIAYDQLTRGILHIFRNETDYAEALPGCELMNRLGCERRIVDADACVALEPALASARPRLVGGIFSPDDESGDAYAFTQRLARLAAGQGAEFRWSTTIASLRSERGRIEAAVTDQGEPIEADAFVLAFASWSPALLRPLGVTLPVYPAKGYSLTIPIGGRAGAPTVSLIDDEFKMVYSRLGDRLRIAGTAEFAGWDAGVTPARAQFLLRTAMALFPDCGDAARAEAWAGLRPSTPDGVPVIGRVPGLENLILNTGHGTLGWTMAAGSGRLVADLLAGRPPQIPLDDLGIERF